MSNVQEAGLLDQGRAAKYEAEYGDYMEIAAESMKDKFEIDESVSLMAMANGVLCSTSKDFV